MSNLYQRNCTRLLDFSDIEIQKIINLASVLKKLKIEKKEIPYLKNKKIALIFEKESTRTRCSFEVAAFDQQANVTYLGPGSTHLGNKESLQDSAEFLSSIYDGIQYRGHEHNNVITLSKHSKVPIWNGLTNKFHPTQLLADLLTMQEITNNKSLKRKKLVYIGDASNNIANTILEASAIMGLNLTIIAPKKYWPEKKLFLDCQSIAKNKDIKIECTDSISEGIKNSDFIYTDVWISMGESKKTWEEKIETLLPYQVNEKLIKLCNKKNVEVLHCLPAFHDNKTIMGNILLKKMGLKYGLEITKKVFNTYRKTIFKQAENRIHTIKALMITTLLKEKSYKN
ncbi:ornithine carbamoyltransferase [Buchnera aphidicola (Mindarus keteleerifoliae)]|uniref:ornithine carbamoyltransferase n=1 Tax=Buchnera aphidicola TaxID=9 RepID=UPI0031B6ED28